MLKLQPDDIQIHFGLPPATFDFEVVSIDTEFFNQDVNKLHRPHGDFGCLACSNDGINVWMVFDPKQIQEVFDRIDESTHAYHNAYYDLIQLRRFATLPDRKKIWDTMLIEQIRFSGWYDQFALNDLARRYLQIYMDKSVRETFTKSESVQMNDEQIFYCAVDVVCTWMVAKAQMEQIDEDDLSIWKHIERDYLWSLLDTDGTHLDAQKWEERYLADEKKAKELDEALPFNPRSPKQVKQFFLEKYKLKLDSTAEGVLAEVFVEHPEIEELKMILDARGLSKAAGTYGKKWIDNLEDGKVYISWHQIGTECLPAGELVLTDRGYIPVQTVVTGDKVITHMGRTKRVENSFVNGVTPIIKVVLDNGLTLRTSSNHPYLLSNGNWIEAANLHLGNEVVVHSSYEQWKRIPGWEDFMVSSWGRVLNDTTGHYLKPQKKGKYGHLKVLLTRFGAQKRGKDRKDFTIHRLVATCFISDRTKSNCEVRHLNGIAWDNTVENLCWGTRMENTLDAISHGTMSHISSSQSKLTKKDVLEIQNTAYVRGVSDMQLARKFGVCRELVGQIRRGNKRIEDGLNREKTVKFSTSYVTNIQYENPEMTYGLTIEHDNSHVTGGIVTHNSGRMTASSPYAIQTVPHDKIYRECFVAAPGYEMVVCDYSSQEPRLLAVITQDDKLRQIFQSGKDIYISVGFEVFGETFDKKDERRKIMKSVILGVSYGMSKYGLSAKINKSVDESEEILNKFFKKFKGVAEWTEETEKWKPYVTTILGRKFWLNPYNNGWTRNTKNFPMQGSAADCTKIAVNRLRKKLGYNPCLIYMHDELVAQFPHEDIEEGAKLLKKVMVETQEWMHGDSGIPGGIDQGIGDSWACKP